ncbi:MAG: hypothetical protein RIR48_3064, partial [Bacteroidota bacterium]
MTSGDQILHGQRSAAMQISIKNGLPSNVVYEIKMDSRGFLWATTDKGVVRYDGRKFRVFTTDDGILSNDNFKIIIDKDDNVWLYALTGISKIDKRFQSHVISRHKPSFSFFGENGKRDIFMYLPDSLDNYNVVKRTFLNIIKGNNTIRIPYKHETFDLQNYYQFSYIHNDSLFFITYNINLMYFKCFTLNYEQKKIIEYPSSFIPNITTKVSGEYEYLQIDPHHAILFKENSYILIKNYKNVKESTYPNNQNRITKYNTFIRNNILYVILKKGIYSLTIHPDGRDEWRLFCDLKNVTSLLFDSEDNIWVSTLGNGIFKYSYISLNNETSSYKFLSSDKIIKLAGFKNKILWAATAEKKVFELHSNTIFPTNDLFDIRFVLCDSTDVFYGGGWSVYKNDEKIQTGIGFKNAGLSKDTVTLASSYGIIFLGKNNLKRNMRRSNTEPMPDITGRSYCVFLEKNSIYRGNQDGLWFGDVRKDVLSPIQLKPNINIMVNNIEKSSDGRIWVSTEGEGVFVLENNKVLVQFKKELLDKTIHSMHIDENDNIWLGTMYGINCIVKKSDKYSIKSYTQFHGLPDNYVFDTYCYNNTLYAATEEGLITFDISRLDAINSKSSTPAYILGIENLSIPGSNLTVDSAYTFKYNE